MRPVKKSGLMEWIDGELSSDAALAERVDQLLGEMRLEQELVALREARGLSQRQAAKLIRVSQPYVAKLESGRVRNVGVGTLVKYAHALGGDVTIAIRRRGVARTMAGAVENVPKRTDARRSRRPGRARVSAGSRSGRSGDR